ncbi:MAG TPA: histidine kinase [Pyrinomonadaceae bacterium]|nr:histidine kinase [Pyrinomonadaceae bacterium]HMP64248.1 histidine kinase [Pyrinomonadaceae bacterium]
MNASDAALLVNWVGFLVGLTLYSLLGFMVLRYSRGREMRGVALLLLATAVLGIVWNMGELVVFVLRSVAQVAGYPLITAAAYSALGFLPSVVVHSAETETSSRRFLTFTAYGLSTVAAMLHFYAVFSGSAVPSGIAMLLLTIGAVSLATLLLVFSIGQTIEKKAIWVSALLVFALSGLHFFATPEGNSWLIELVAHQSSIPLALVILYQNYRFAFADLFLKRAISIMLLASLTFGLYVGVAAPLLRFQNAPDQNDVTAVSLILVLWMITALIYPSLYKLANWLVDKVILNRADYITFQNDMAGEIELAETADSVAGIVSNSLARVLTANRVRWRTLAINPVSTGGSNVSFGPEDAKVMVPTVEGPFYEIELGELQGGRRIMSDDVAMLDAVSHIAARKIDALRVTHERCEQEIREQEFSKLATEAQLTALRAQINPHFLFNALTTIGYLTKTAPEKAFQTLIQLTKLLRGILSSTGEFCSLGDEIKLIESYLEIEHARFEERLAVDFEIPDDLLSLTIPSLILQPLVENAIKHGISERKDGGLVTVAARRIEVAPDSAMLEVSVENTAPPRPLRTRTGGVGIYNIENRLRSHFGYNASFRLDLSDPVRTRALVSIPIADGEARRSRRKAVSV